MHRARSPGPFVDGRPRPKAGHSETLPLAGRAGRTNAHPTDFNDSHGRTPEAMSTY